MKKFIMLILVSAFLVGCKAKIDFKTSVNDLGIEYSNDQKADEKYKGKILELTGKHKSWGISNGKF